MKEVKISMLMAMMILSFSQVMAQQKNDVDAALSKQFDKTLTKMNSIDLNQNKDVKKAADALMTLEEAIDLSLRQINDDVERGRKEIEKKKNIYIPQPTTKQQIDKDLLPRLAGIPEPVTSLPVARKTVKISEPENVYTRYIDGLKQYRDGLAEQARKTVPANQKDPEQLKKEASQNAKNAQRSLENNPMIQEMGGMEKLKNMTPEQRAAVGKQMAEKVKQNPNAYTAQADPKKAFAQKMMTDPSYAARYDHMNDEQKQEEYKAFMDENGFVDNSSQADKNKRMADRDRAATSVAIEKRLALIRAHAQELADISGSLKQHTDEYYTNLNNKLSNQYAKRVEALPVVEHGEAGKGKDTRPVDMAYNIVVYPLGVQNAVSNKEVWKRFVEMAKITIAEYNELLSEFWGRDKATDQLMIEKGLSPAAISTGLCDQLIDLTQQAKLLTGQNASWQRQYDEKVLQVYE